jgi:hypothetical protein
MRMDPLLRSSFETLRSRFEQAASDFYGVRCFLVKESYKKPYDSGDTPVLHAVAQHLQNGDLKAIIGHQAAGINCTFGGQISYGNVFFAGWFVHDRLSQAIRHGSHSDDMQKSISVESNRAIEYKARFKELSAEAAGLLLEIPCGKRLDSLESLLRTPRLIAGQMLWLAAMFSVALKRPPGSGLSVGVYNPKIVEIDFLKASGTRELLESVIYELRNNPFAASSTVITLLLSADNQADKKEKTLKRLPRDPDVLALAKVIMKNHDPDDPTKSKISIALEFTDGNELKAKRLIRQLQPDRYSWLLELPADK